MIITGRPLVRVGIAGLGRSGLETQIPELIQKSEMFQIIAVCDPAKDRRDLAFERLPDVRTYRRFEDLLADPDIELVSIATRSDDHAKHAVQALKTKKWVNVERPFCCDHDEAMMLRSFAINAGNRLLVRHNYRYEPAFVQVREVIESGVLGDIYNIRMRRGVYERRDDWQAVKRCGGGAGLTWGTAFLDHALELLRTPPVKIWSDLKRVAAVGDAEDYMHVIMKNMAGLTVDLEVSGGRVTEVPIFRISGSKGEFTISADGETANWKYLDPDVKLERRRASVRNPALGSYGTPEELKWVEISKPVAPEAPAGMTLIWDHVYSTVRENKPFPIPLDTSIETMRVLTLIKKESPYA